MRASVARPRASKFSFILVLAASCLACTPVSMGQEVPLDQDTEVDASQVPSEDANDASAGDEILPGQRRMRGTDDTQMVVRLEQFGVGGFARPGDWAGLRVEVTDKASAARNVIVRLSTIDSDGDIAQQQREIATNPGTKVAVWMYIRVPFADRKLEVSVYESREAGDASLPEELRARTGDLLGGVSLTPSEMPGSVVADSISLVGLLGQQPLGLLQYAQRYMREPVAENGNELTQLVTGLKPTDLPDRWMGLASMEAIVWGAGDPLELQRSAMRADAIKQWVERGGHLIIVLPSVGQVWFDAQNPLSSIMPQVSVERKENALMAPYKPLLTTPLERADPFPAKATVHILTPDATAAEGDAIPVLTGPEGEVVVARRLIGTGAVTVIGLDLNHPNIRPRIFADVFWHRILGRRGDLNPPADRTTAVAGGIGGMGSLLGGSWYVDKSIPSLTDIMGKSAIGAAAAFALFAVYWLFVGPPLYWALRKRSSHHQSWLIFMLGVAIFSLIAWIAATTLRPRKAEATVFAILDHVYTKEIAEGVPQQRARVWGSVLIPRYGEARVSVGSPMGDDPNSRSTLAPFDAPEGEPRIGGFPDTRGYPIDTLTPDAASMPARATVKTFVADWAGSPVWAMPLPAAPDGSPSATAAIMLRSQVIEGDGVTTQTRINSREQLPTGTLVHKLPAPLKNITMVLVRKQSPLRGVAGDFSAVSTVLSIPNFIWNPDEALSIEAPFRTLTGSANSLASALDNFKTGRSDGTDPAAVSQQMLAMSFMHLLPPVDRANLGIGSVRPAQRRITHGLDLSRWTTQPCLIIMGTVELPLGRQSPVPLYLDGESLPTRGLVMVRWIYPLPADPPEFTDQAKDQKPRASEREKTTTDKESGNP